ncbi:MAG: DUF3224 domain-containing protein [Marmoricola sp.]
MNQTARGTFAVDIAQRPQDPDTEGLGQMTLRKTWSGGIEATGWGLMISGGDPGAGCAGYVAMEVVDGVVGDRNGRFALQQFGTMLGGETHQVYEVVPGSGTGELSGLSGTLALSVEDGAHVYVLSYEVP